MEWWHAVVLGIVEGITEFLPVSSTGHVTVVQKLLGYTIDSPDMTAFAAIIQIGSILAAVLYFWKDITRIVAAWWKGLFDKKARTSQDYRMGWMVIVGSLPIAIVGLAFHTQIETTLRSLWVVAIALLVWSGVMWIADATAKQVKDESKATWKDTLLIGVVQCLALIPGVSRSGATISVGLLRGFDRVAATKLAFFLGIPALLAAGMYQAASQFNAVADGAGWAATIIGTITAFIVSYIVVSWLLRFIAHHSYMTFIWYRIGFGVLLIAFLSIGIIPAV